MALVESLWYDGPQKKALYMNGEIRYMGGFISLNETRADSEKHRDFLVERYGLDARDFHFVRLHLAQWEGTGS